MNSKKSFLIVFCVLFISFLFGQNDWEAEVLDTVSYGQWGWFKGYSQIDLISENNTLHFSAHVLKDSLNQNDENKYYGIIVYGKYVNGDWQIDSVTETKNSRHPRSTSLCLDEEGKPSIFYVDHPNGSTDGNIRNASWNGSSWEVSNALIKKNAWQPISAFKDQHGIGCAYSDVTNNWGPNYEQY